MHEQAGAARRVVVAWLVYFLERGPAPADCAAVNGAVCGIDGMPVRNAHVLQVLVQWYSVVGAVQRAVDVPVAVLLNGVTHVSVARCFFPPSRRRLLGPCARVNPAGFPARSTTVPA